MDVQLRPCPPVRSPPRTTSRVQENTGLRRMALFLTFRAAARGRSSNSRAPARALGWEQRFPALTGRARAIRRARFSRETRALSDFRTVPTMVCMQTVRFSDSAHTRAHPYSPQSVRFSDTCPHAFACAQADGVVSARSCACPQCVRNVWALGSVRFSYTWERAIRFPHSPHTDHPAHLHAR